MARIKVDLPPHFHFSTTIAVRITDINYGGHVGNDAILSLIHEARMRFLQHIGYTEMNFAGAALIMSDVAIEYKSEIFYGDSLNITVGFNDIGKVGFDMVYKIEKASSEKNTIVALAKTGMVSFDYQHKKIISLPAEALNKFNALPIQ
jgi:acyl-CoA thioester hydrolase